MSPERRSLASGAEQQGNSDNERGEEADETESRGQEHRLSRSTTADLRGGSRTLQQMRSVVAAFLLVSFVALVSGARSIVSAECDGPYPPFEEAVVTASRVIYGDVVEARPVEWGAGDGLTSRFTVRGWSLREPIESALVDIDDVSSTPCSGYLVARFGDRVAIAFEGRAFGTEVNAMVWTAGQPPDHVGLERIAERDLLELVGIAGPLPTVADSDSDDLPTPMLVAAGFGVAVAVIALAGAAILRAQSTKL